MITVGNLMKKELVTVDAGTSVVEAAKLMKTCNVGSVLVSQEGRIVGIVTEPDIVRKVVGAERIPYYIPVEDIMSSPVLGAGAVWTLVSDITMTGTVNKVAEGTMHPELFAVKV